MAKTELMQNHNKLLCRKKWAVRILGPFFQHRFRCTFDIPKDLPQNILLLSNHESDYDPFLLYLAFPNHFFYFLMSEHLFRLKLVGALARWINEPIAAMRHVADLHSVRSALSILKNGGNIAFFPAGEREWDGYTPFIPDSIGKFAAKCKVPIATFNFEGMYFVHPRWSKKMRTLPTHGRIVNVYTPEQIESMSAEELSDCIRKDLVADSDAWRQNIKIATKSKAPAEWLEQALFLCPQCGSIDSMHSHGDMLECSCGLSARYTDRDVFADGTPFHTVHEWTEWQIPHYEEMLSQAFIDQPEIGLTLYDDNVEVYSVDIAKTETLLETGTLSFNASSVTCGSWVCNTADIQGFGLVAKRRIILMTGNEHYEFRLPQPADILKYELYFKFLKEHKI